MLIKYHIALILFVAALPLTILSACKVNFNKLNSTSEPINHQTWDALLKKHVSAEGKVDYAGFKEDAAELDAYLKLLSDNHPNEVNWSENERLAYWINAYNAFTVKLIVDNYPVKSIKEIGKGPNIPFVNTPWDIKFIKIEGQTYDLNNIEHGILRKHFNEPRIHFAVNCASVSCPNLRNEAFIASRLDEQLSDSARQFLADSGKNKLRPNKAELSKIFDWFKGDFTKNGQSLIQFLNQYAPVTLNPDAEISHLKYDWSLNE